MPANTWRRLSPIAGVFIVAITARLIVAVIVSIYSDGVVYLDEPTYLRLASDWADGRTAWAGHEGLLFANTRGLLVPLGVIFKLTGAVMLIGQMLVALFGSATAALVTAMGDRVGGRAMGWLAGILAALWPSQVIMSSILMKDALVWFGLASLGLLAMKWWTMRGWSIVAGGGAVACPLLFMGTLRPHTMVAAAIALLVAAGFLRVRGMVSTYHIVASGILLVIVPWLLGFGPTGTKVMTSVDSVSNFRAAQAQGNSALDVAVEPRSTEESETRPRPGTIGAQDVAYAPKGLTAVLLEPLPWRASSSVTLRAAQAENIAWYAVLLLAAGGIASVLKRSPELVFPLVVAAGLALMWSMVEGNIGTAFRHRGEFVWVILLIASAFLMGPVRQWSAKREKSR